MPLVTCTWREYWYLNLVLCMLLEWLDEQLCFTTKFLLLTTDIDSKTMRKLVETSKKMQPNYTYFFNLIILILWHSQEADSSLVNCLNLFLFKRSMFSPLRGAVKWRRNEYEGTITSFRMFISFYLSENFPSQINYKWLVSLTSSICREPISGDHSDWRWCWKHWGGVCALAWCS